MLHEASLCPEQKQNWTGFEVLGKNRGVDENESTILQ